MLRFPVALALVSLSVPALAADPASGADAKPVKEKKACRRDTPLGSNIPHSTCHTAAEWREIDQTASDSAQQAIANARSGRH